MMEFRLPTAKGWAFRPQLTISGLSLIGPGQGTALSVGIRVLASADQAVMDNIRIDGFDVGMHFLAPNTGLLWGNYISNVVVGFGSTNSGAALATTNTAVHLEGPVANIKFVNLSWLDGSA